MPAYKDKITGKWFAQFYCKNWQGDNKLIKKRRFATKREALEFERVYKMKETSDLNMTFEDFFELYTTDKKQRLKLNTWLTKEHIVRSKVMPYFRNRKINEITAGDIVKWQNELIAYKDEDGNALSDTYRKTIHNQLSAIFNHAVRYYDLKSNPARKAGNMGKEQHKEMLIWTRDEYQKFSQAIMNKERSFYAFEMLYWCGIRLGELLALTMEDFDFVNNTVRINKSYQRLQGQDYITTPKTPKSNRTIKMLQFLVAEMQEYMEMLYGYKQMDRIFQVTKAFLHHELERGCRDSDVKRIRLQDLRNSAVSLLIDLGFSVVAIADRVGHKSIENTFRYAHLFSSKQTEMAIN